MERTGESGMLPSNFIEKSAGDASAPAPSQPEPEPEQQPEPEQPAQEAAGVRCVFLSHLCPCVSVCLCAVAGLVCLCAVCCVLLLALSCC